MMHKLIKCKTCGQEIAKTAKVCPYCGARQHQGVLTACAIIIVATIFACGAILIHAEKPSDDVSQEPVASISAVDLYSAYLDNAVNADNLYKDKIIAVSGSVSDITTDMLTGNPCVCLDSKSDFGIYPIQCFFDDSHVDEIATLVDGDQITITGKCSGNTVGIVQLSGCSISH